MGLMQVEILRKDNYEVMPWKNGLGETAQIDIWPADAAFPSDGFHWRLSSARVETDSDFSQFSECERWLVVWQGAGFLLNDKKLAPDQPLRFSGEEPIHCRLLHGEVLDLGLIFRPSKVRTEFTVYSFNAAQSVDFHTDSPVTYLFCARGQVQASNGVLLTGDTLKITGLGALSLGSAEGATCYLIKLFDA